MDMESLNDLYQELILEHSKQPRCFGILEQPSCSTRGHNPLCGDEITLYLKVEADRIVDIAFEAKGCAISVASASLMAEALKGRTIAEAQTLFASFHSLLTNGEQPTQPLGDLQALAGVRQFPIRIKCATLAWHALADALATSPTESTVSPLPS